MKSKETAILFIFLIFTFPFLIKFIIWTFVSTTDPSIDNIEKGVDFIAESAIPWWIKPIEWLASLGEIGAILIVGFIFFLKWVGEVK